MRLLLVNIALRRNEVSHGSAMLRSYLASRGHIMDVRQIVLSRGHRLLDSIRRRMLKDTKGYGLERARVIMLDRMIRKLPLQDYGLLGFSIMGEEAFDIGISLAKRIRVRNRIPIVFGGAYIKLFHEMIDITEVPFVDYWVCGDGEAALLGIIRHIDDGAGLEQVPSIRYMSGGKAVMHSIKNIPVRFTTLPMYDDDLFLEGLADGRDRQWFGIPYQLTRGCPNSCAFCCHRLLDKMEYRPVAQVIDHLKTLKARHRYDRFRFTDSNINMDEHYLCSVCQAIIEEGIKIEWWSMAAPTLRLETLNLMRRSGCTDLVYGLETGSQRLNSLVGKPFTVSRARECIKDTALEGIRCHINLIVGLPSEDDEDIAMTCSFLEDNMSHLFHVEVIPFTLYAQTEMQQHPERFGLIVDSCRPICIFSEEGRDSRIWRHDTRQRAKALHKTLSRCGIRHEIDEITS